MKLIFSLLSIFVVIISGLLVAPSFVDWSQYKDEIKTQVESATGYKLDLNGDISAVFLPTPHMTLNDIAVDSNGAEGPVGFKGDIGKISVSVALMPLLSGNIVVSDVTLINPVIDVREQKSSTAGQEKLEKLTAENATDESSATPNVQLDNVYLEGAKLSYQPLSGDKMMVELPTLRMSANSLQGPFTIDGRVIYNTFDVGVGGKVGEIIDGQPTTITMAIDGGAYDLNYNGLVDISKADPEIQGEFKVKADSIKSLAGQFGANDITIKDQSFGLSGLIAGNTNAIRLDNGQLNLSKAGQPMPVKFNYNVESKKGAIKVQSLPGGGMVDLDIAMNKATSLNGQIDIRNLRILTSDVLGLVEAKVFENPQMPRSVSGDINASLGDAISLISKSMTVGDFKLLGTNVTYVTGVKPKVNVKIDSFEGAKISASGTLDMEEGVNVSVSHPNAVKFIRLFQKDFSSSPSLEKSFSFQGVVKSDNDKIIVSNMASKIGEVDATGGVSIDNSGTVPSISADLMFGNLDTQALITGKKSSTTTTASGETKVQSTKTSSGSPWTRDAIDTSALRSININLTAKAKQLVHGTWLISNPIIDIDLKDGVLDINTIKGGLFGGNVDMSSRVSATSEGQPLSISSKINASQIDLNKFVKAAMSQNKDRLTGTGDFNISLSTSGLSSSALAYGLNADGKVATSDIIIKGIDLMKVTEAISDESLTDLATVIQGAFKAGQTPFEPVDYTIAIREGTMPVNNFTLVSPTAKLISNGTVSFSNWNMDVKNTVDFTDPDDLPNVEMTIKGPLNAPKQNVASDVLRSFIMNKYGAKIQNKVDKLLGDKLKDTPAAGIINNLLGLPQKETEAPVANDNQVAPTTAPSEKPQPKVEEQLIRGLFDQLAK